MSGRIGQHWARPVLTQAQMRGLVKKAAEDPVWWTKHFLLADLWGKQREIIESVRDNRFTSVVACHSPGKTFTAAQAVLWFYYTHRPSKVISTAPTFRQVNSLLWSEIRSAHARGSHKRPLGGTPLKTRLEMAPNHFCEGFASSEYDPERTQGYHSPNILIVVDEASGVPDGVFDSLESLMASGDAHLLLLGNPTRAGGRFHESFSNPLFHNITIDAYSTPNFTEFGITRDDMLSGAWKTKIGDSKLPRDYLITPQWVNERYVTWGPESTLCRTKIEAQFPTDETTDKVIPMSYLDMGSQLEFPEDVADAPIHIGVDVARFGNDSSVITVRAGRQPLFERILYQKDTMSLVGAIHQVVQEVGPLRVESVRIDVIGMGGGPCDRLRELQDNGVFPTHIVIIGLSVAAQAKNPARYVRQRDSIWFELREKLKAGTASTKGMSSEALLELSIPEFTWTSDYKIKVESKDETRKVLGHSPDRADSWLLCFTEDYVQEKTGRRLKLRVRSGR